MLSFTATYSDGTTGSVIPSSYTPTSFGDTVGTQTVTFSFEGTDITVDVDYDVEAATPVEVTSLTFTGTLTNPQIAGDAPDFTGLTFTYGLSNGQSVVFEGNAVVKDASTNKVITAISGSVDSNGKYNMVGSTILVLQPADTDGYWTALGYEIQTSPYPEADVPVVIGLDELSSLSVSGDWTNAQIAGNAPDLTGLTFTATYDNGFTRSVSTSDITVSPATWGSTVGTQTATFSYTEDGVTKTTTKDATVTVLTVTSISYTGTLGTQYLDDYMDISGLTFNFGLNNGQSVTVTGQQCQDAWDQGTPSYLNTYSDWLNSETWKWQEYQGSTTATLLCEPDTYTGNYWTTNGYEIATPTPGVTITGIELQTH